MHDAVLAFFVLCAVASSAFFVWVRMGFDRARARHYDAAGTDDVTVVVAMHNEVARIPALLRALAAQTYPREKLRVIIADDRSTDGSADAVRAHCPSTLACTVLRIDAVEPGISPKKHALHQAILAAESDVLLCTDADCRPEARWVEAMAARFSSGADVVLGVSPVLPGGAVVDAYARYEAARTAMTYLGAAGWKRPYMAVGRNWGYRRSLYERSGGLEPLFGELGGDDDLLLQCFLSQKPEIAVCTDPDAACGTGAPGSFAALLRQKLRHYRAGARYRGAPGVMNPLHWLVFVGAAEFLSVIVAPLWLLLLQNVAWWIVAGGLLAKLTYDTRFLNPLLRSMTGWRGSVADQVRAALLEFFHVIFSSVIAPLSLLLPRKW